MLMRILLLVVIGTSVVVVGQQRSGYAQVSYVQQRPGTGAVAVVQQHPAFTQMNAQQRSLFLQATNAKQKAAARKKRRYRKPQRKFWNQRGFSHPIFGQRPGYGKVRHRPNSVSNTFGRLRLRPGAVAYAQRRPAGKHGNSTFARDCGFLNLHNPYRLYRSSTVELG